MTDIHIDQPPSDATFITIDGIQVALWARPPLRLALIRTTLVPEQSLMFVHGPATTKAFMHGVGCCVSPAALALVVDWLARETP
jgi:hypothetical protein